VSEEKDWFIGRSRSIENPSGFQGYGLLKYFALPADFHLLMPALLDLPLADRTIDAPAKFASLKFPCRTMIPGFFRTL